MLFLNENWDLIKRLWAFVHSHSTPNLYVFGLLKLGPVNKLQAMQHCFSTYLLTERRKHKKLFSPKVMFYYQTFFLLQICTLLDCSQEMPRKKMGGHRACFLTNCRERWTWFRDRSHDGYFARRGLGRDTKSRPSCSKYALEIKIVFGCFYAFDIANTEIQT